ncbi:FAS1-like dehydratase domain-containing protein [Haloglycomyces albus]|uniref:FAS1-like dehydratase domain-containing protein n=1 Tax=Haloglycomyces albus TaxID=526067 RepID=UPI00046D3764|nr:MaoC family dehydratase N-terminal domain-containing protein [Haloglycomyces albus]
MLNTSYVGQSLPKTDSVEIAPESVAAFASALGLEDTRTVPPTFLISLTLPASDRLIEDPDFGLDFSKVLHREQQFDYYRQPRVGDVVNCTVTVESIKEVAGNELLTLSTLVETADEPIAKVTTVLFVAGE